jgi:hypothetical protein
MPPQSNTPPSPPTDLPTDLVDTLEGWSAERLRLLARYAEEVAEHRECEDRRDEEAHRDDAPSDHPDDVPSKATLTIKEINDNRYYYWQWRDGEKIKSKYEGPVTPDE